MDRPACRTRSLVLLALQPTLMVALVSAALLFAPPARANTLVVTLVSDRNSGTCSTNPLIGCSLREAVSAAESGDSITFGVTGTLSLTLGLVSLDKTVSLIGPGADQLAVSAQHLSGIFEVSAGKQVLITGLTLRNGAPQYGSGGAILNWGALTLTHSVLADNLGFDGGAILNIGSISILKTIFISNAAYYGGGGLNNGGTSTVSDSTFSANSAYLGGGIRNGGRMTLTNSFIDQNIVTGGTGGGGGIANLNDLTIISTTLVANSASPWGGAVFNGGRLLVAGSIISGNSSVGGQYLWGGGGIFNYDGSHLSIDSTYFVGNHADYGGAIVTQRSFLTLTNSTLVGNSAQWGGAIDYSVSGYGLNSSVFVTKTTFLSNTASDRGGAIVSDGPMTVGETTFTSNRATKGGALYAYGILSLSNCVFASNAATESGGAIATLNGSDMKINDSSLTGNTATEGGALFNQGVLTLSNSILISNSAVITGGGVANLPYGRLSLLGTTLRGNASGGAGGGAYSAGALSLDHSTIVTNSANGSGGGLLVVGSSVISGSSVMSNAGLLGGGISNGGSIQLNNTLVLQNRASYGGGIRNELAGSMTLSGSTVTGNSSDNGGGILNEGPLTIMRSLIWANVADNGGGILNNAGDLSIDSTSVVSNSGGIGAGIFNMNDSRARIAKSTIASNTGIIGGGIHNEGNLYLVNSTLSGNSSSQSGGAIAQQGGNAFSVIVNSTIISNTSQSDAQSGGILVSWGPMTLTNNIVAHNGLSATENFSISFGAFVSGGHNLSNGSIPLALSSDIQNRNPLLGPLQDNGGPTLTYLPLPGSPAINGGTNTACPATDQRGVVRPQHLLCDIGAVELEFNFRALLPFIRK